MDYRVDGADGDITLLFAHGAGAPMDSPVMDSFAQSVAEQGIRVVRFEFPYMQKRRADGRKRPPDRQPVLLECWQQVIADQAGHGPLVIGGKSMGGRMAVTVQPQAAVVAGVVCLGYPFHPPGKLDKLRLEPLQASTAPVLVLQGERDTFGNQTEVESYELPQHVQCRFLADGNHDLKPRKASGLTHEDNLAAAVAETVSFINALRI